MDVMKKCSKPSGVRKKLRQLPKTLEATYDRIIENVPEEHRADARPVLQLISVSYRPLHISEVVDAICVDCESDKYDHTDRSFDDEVVLENCSSLVTLSRYVGKFMSDFSNRGIFSLGSQFSRGIRQLRAYSE